MEFDQTKWEQRRVSELVELAVPVEATPEERQASPVCIPGETPVFQNALGVSLAVLDNLKVETGGRLPEGPILIDTGIDPFKRPADRGIWAWVRSLFS